MEDLTCRPAILIEIKTRYRLMRRYCRPSKDKGEVAQSAQPSAPSGGILSAASQTSEREATTTVQKTSAVLTQD